MGQDNSRALEELPPHDETSEWMLICCLVHKPELIRGMSVSLFYVENCRRILLKMQQFVLEQNPSISDPALFLHELGRSLENHNYEPLFRSMDDLHSPENWPYWLKILEEHQTSRRLLSMSPRIYDASLELVRGNSGPLESLRSELKEISNDYSGPEGIKSVHSVIPGVIDQLEKDHKAGGCLQGITTGLTSLDRATNGLQDGRFYIFAGRPGEGKSSLLMTIAHGASNSGKKVLYFSLEMSAEELTSRLLASQSRVVLGRFSRATATQQDFDAVGRAMLPLRKTTINIVDSMSTLTAIVHAASVEIEKGRADLIVVDYIQRIRIPNFKSNRNELVTEISNAMKDLAMSSKVPVVAAAQLNRSVTKDDREPNLADLRDSGALEQDADFVGLLHSENQNETKMLVAKNRSGDTGVILFTFRREITRFDSPV